MCGAGLGRVRIRKAAIFSVRGVGPRGPVANLLMVLEVRVGRGVSETFSASPEKVFKPHPGPRPSRTINNLRGPRTRTVTGNGTRTRTVSGNRNERRGRRAPTDLGPSSLVLQLLPAPVPGASVFVGASRRQTSAIIASVSAVFESRLDPGK
jgi:hypothetical protein